MRRALALVAAVAACGKDRDPPPRPAPPRDAGAADVLTGTLRVGDRAATLTACRPGQDARVFVDVVTSLGTLRFSAGQLHWNAEPLACEQLDRSWGGGARTDGTAYFRGTLAFRCTHASGPITGTLTLDCGQITAAERAALDQNRAALRDEQRGSAPPP